jgi:uncharacterized protein YqeY
MTDESILEQIQLNMTAAMKARDAGTLSTLRMLKAALMEARTKKAKDAAFSRDEEIEVLQRYAKKRRETIEEWKKLGREDLVPGEEREIAVTQRYLPQGLSEDEVRAVVLEAVAKTGATSPKELGKVMGAVMAQVKGRADGTLVTRLVRESLGG